MFNLKVFAFLPGWVLLKRSWLVSIAAHDALIVPRERDQVPPQSAPIDPRMFQKQEQFAPCSKPRFSPH